MEQVSKDQERKGHMQALWALFRKVVFFARLFLIFILYWSIVDLQCCISGVQQRDSVIHIHIAILSQILFPHRLLQNIEQRPLCYIVGPVGCLFYIQQRVYVNPKLLIQPSPNLSPLVSISLFLKSVSLFLFCK